MGVEENRNGRRRSPPGPGPKPGERVFAGGKRRPPSIRVKSAAGNAGTGGLAFEPEPGAQMAALAELASGAAVTKSNLAFEPDEGDLLDRVRDTRLPLNESSPVRPKASSREVAAASGSRKAGPAGTDDADIASLIELAANAEREKGSTSVRGRSFTPAPRRADLSGDLEAELFGPRRSLSGRGPAPVAKAAPADPKPRQDARERGSRSGDGDDASAKPRGWSSVLVSDAVVGRKRRRTTARLFRTTRFAEKAIGRRAVQAAGVARSLDALLRRVRLSLAGLLAIGAIVALALLTGVPLLWAGGVVAVCLVLTLSGQPARNLLGYAGVIVTAAALAEIVRQRERFLEMLRIFMG